MPHNETYVDGVWYPSVSTVTGSEPKPWLDNWREKWGYLAERKTEMANKIGTEFHRCVEEYLSEGCFLVDIRLSTNMRKRIERMMMSFIQWAETVNGDIHDMELKVISRQHVYSGTLDAVGTFNGKPMLYDWKTSSRIYPDMDLQLVAYAQAYKEQTGIELKQGMIVHVSKDKPHFKLTTKVFKLGKRPLAKFLKLRAMFDEMMTPSEAVE
jgi:hypothetical protein